VYFGRGELILKERERLKKMAIINWRNEYKTQNYQQIKKNFTFELLTKYSFSKSPI
jgi:hypothetical protein